MNNKKQRVVIVEDHPMFRERLSQLINRELDMEVCGEADDSQEAIRLIRDTSPNLAIIDITLKGSSGLELVKSIRARSIFVPVLVLSMHDESIYADRALRVGANGYITKQQATEEVLSAIRRVLAGEIYLSEKMTDSYLKSLGAVGARRIARPLDRLSDRELQVLEFIGRGYNSNAIAEALKVGVATVDTYRARIKQKMDFRGAFELQHFAIRWVRDRD
jgi:DNA-binding NarL/FixJ family response regulator